MLTIWTGTGKPDGSPGLVVRIIENTDDQPPTVVASFTLTPEEILALLRGSSIDVEQRTFSDD